MQISKTPILNVNVSCVNYQKTLYQIKRWISTKQKKYICVAAVHLIMECQNKPQLLYGVNKADLVVTDGMPLVWLTKLYRYQDTERVYGPKLMLKICEYAQNNKIKIFLLGGAPNQSRELLVKLIKLFPKLLIVGNQDTPTRPINKKNNNQIIKQINRSNAQIVFIGMGCPYQELWMIENRINLKPNILIGVGAAFDLISGRIKQAPKYMQQIGMEWLFRFIQEPKRLWYRYTVLNVKFIYRLITIYF